MVQRDVLQLLGITGWRRRAENRDEWTRFMREAKAGRDCSPTYGWMILRLIVFVVGNYMCHVTYRGGSGEQLYKVVATGKSKYFS